MIPKGQLKINNPETLATQGTQDEEKHNKNTATFQNTCTQEEFEDTKGVIRIRISKKNRQHNEHKLHPSATFYMHRLLLINVRQNRRHNPETLAHKTQNETQTKQQQQHNITQKAKTTAQHNTES